MARTTNQVKGDALEDAVRMVEMVILEPVKNLCGQKLLTVITNSKISAILV